MDDDQTSNLPVKPDAVGDPADLARSDDPMADDPLAGALGGLDLGSLLEMAGQVQQQMEDAQARAAETTVEGTSGGGAVRVTVTGTSEFTSVTISPDAVDDIEMLQDLVLAAIRDALEQVKAMQSESMGGLGGAIGGLGDLFGA
jgi:DNA-binding YbaB/EbfC family protein